MFDYSILHWTTFLTTALLLNLSPGPDMAFILGQTIRSGRRGGFAATAGVWSGTLVHVFLTAGGLSAVVATSAIAFSVVKWVGAAYLLWLGFCALRSHGFAMAASPRHKHKTPRAIFRQGVLVALFNPKVAIFFLALLPQFVVVGAGPAWAQLLLHGVLIIAMAAFVEPPLVCIGERLTQKLRQNQKISLWMERTLGALLISLGIRLALEKR